MSKIIITGGAGFIGSAIVAELNKRGTTDIIIVDRLDHDEKEHNLQQLQYDKIIDGNDFREQLSQDNQSLKEADTIIHLAAITSTTERDWSLFQDVNINFSQEVIRWAADSGIRCIYISSGATYGDGQKGYSDNHALFDQLQPLNDYGRSKLDVDIWARDAGYLEKVVGLRYFNVYGPNEYHKKTMRSVVLKKFTQIQEQGYIELFKSNNPNYGDGEQMRDFIYIKDAVRATLFFYEKRDVTGVFNIGTGIARTWNDLAFAMFAAIHKKPDIRYIDIPANLADQYQDYTQADIKKLLNAGYDGQFMSLEEAVSDYINNYLVEHTHIISEHK